MQVPNKHEDVRSTEDFDLLLVPPGKWKDIVVQSSADEDRGLRIQAEGLSKRQTGLLHLEDIVIRRSPAPQHLLDLLLHRLHLLRIREEAESRPSQQSSRRLVPRDHHRHQVIPQLPLRRIGTPHVHEETEQGGILESIVVALLQRLDVLLRPGQQRFFDQLVQAVVDQLDVALEPLLPLHQRAHAEEAKAEHRELPVGEKKEGPMLRLLHQVVHCVDDRALALD
mmetsp:Transcript_10121/g.23079  ORF Transcript_10121/g.23079 Transcript_10121/m.23079 type:complete len:225 (+) Transcript_10121:406-1080(+)